MRFFFLSVLLAGLAACSETRSASSGAPAPPDVLALMTDRAAYAPGATAAVTFQNGTDESVSLAQPLACVTVEREAADGWEPVPSDQMCAAVLVPVEAGQTTTAEVTVPASAGTYRVSQRVYPETGDGRLVASSPFQVR